AQGSSLPRAGIGPRVLSLALGSRFRRNDGLMQSKLSRSAKKSPAGWAGLASPSYNPHPRSRAVVAYSTAAPLRELRRHSPAAQRYPHDRGSLDHFGIGLAMHEEPQACPAAAAA